MIPFTPQPQEGQVYRDPATGGYYTYQRDPKNAYSPFAKLIKTPLSNFGQGQSTPANQTPATVGPRAGLGPSIQDIYGGTTTPTTPYQPAVQPNYQLPNFDMSAVLARAQQGYGAQPQQYNPSFMATVPNSAQSNVPISSNAGIAALTNVANGVK